jgi:hypothetical protein
MTLELLRHAVQARKAGKLEVSELAEARQAANDCSGWLQRLGGLLGSSVGGQTGRTHRDSNNLAGFSEATKEALRVLQQEMAVLHRTFQAAYPGRKGFAMSGTPRASEMAAAQPARCSTSARRRARARSSCWARAPATEPTVQCTTFSVAPRRVPPRRAPSSCALARRRPVELATDATHAPLLRRRVVLHGLSDEAPSSTVALASPSPSTRVRAGTACSSTAAAGALKRWRCAPPTS